MPTITTTEAFIVDGVATSALEQRLYDTAMFLGDGSNNGIRGGICFHGPTSLGVTVNGSDQVTVQAGACVIPAGTGLGVWRGTLAAATSAVALTARNATNPRIDLIVAQATGTNLTIKTIDGTPAASPVAPALPAQHIELARVTVPQVAGGAVTVDSTWRTFATALGGTLLVPTAARLPGSGSLLSQRAIALDTGIYHIWTGAAWEVEGVGHAYTPSLPSGIGPGNGTVTGRWVQHGKTVHFWAKFVMGSTSTVGGAPTFGLPVAARAAQEFAVLTAHYLDASASIDYAGPAQMPSTTTVSGWVQGGAGGAYGVVSATNPFTFAVNDTIEVRGTYEAA